MAEQPLTAGVVFPLAALPPAEDQGMPYAENDRIVKHTDEARAAVTGHNVRYVLLIGTLAVIVLFAVAYLASSG